LSRFGAWAAQVIVGVVGAGVAALFTLSLVWLAVGPGRRANPVAGRPPVRWSRFVGWCSAWYACYALLLFTVPKAARPLAVHNGLRVLGWSGGVGVERWLLHLLSPLAGPLGVYYQMAHLWVTAMVLVWVARRDPAGWKRAAPVLLVCSSLALLVFWRFPVAPPRDLGLGGFRLSGIESAGAVPFAAVPSLHVCWAVWCDWCLWGRVRRLRFLLGAHTLLTLLAVVATGNHYLFDCAAGFDLFLLGVAVVVWAPHALNFGRRLSGRRAAAPAQGADTSPSEGGIDWWQVA
jgi:hypothetical protein